MAYTKYSLTPANNNATPPDGAPEGMLPSAVNDTMRDMMAQIRDVGDGIRNGTYTMTAPVITGGSITGVALSGNTFTNPVITGGSINNTPIGASTASTGAFTTMSASGATTFSGATVVSGSLTANTFSSSGATITGGSINSTAIGGSTAAAGAFTTLSASGAFAANGGATLGDASGDALTINSSAVSIPNGLNFDSNTFVIDATNNRVGIGTSSPTGKLSVYDTSGTGLIFTNANSSEFAIGSLNSAGAEAYVYNRANSPLIFGANNTERMRITSAGNVGIGTSSPNSGDNVGVLSVQTSQNFGISIYRNSVNPAQIAFLDNNNSSAIGTDGASNLIFYNNSRTTERMRIDSSGNVGIGTSSPGTVVDVSRSQSADSAIRISNTSSNASARAVVLFGNNTDTGSVGFFLNSSANTGLAGANSFNLYQGLNAPVSFWTNATERMRINSSGNVGIGTSSPTTALTVAGVGRFISGTEGTQIGHNGTIGYIETAGNSATPITFYNGGAERMRIDSSGNILVGITSARSNAGDVQVSKGISFPATQSAQSDANTLDDYEEGTWTPQVAGVTTAGTGTYTTQVGTYTKIGRVVTIQGNITWTAHTGTGNLLLWNFPFTSNSTTGAQYGVTFSFVNNLTLPANGVMVGNIPEGGTYANLYTYTLGTGAQDNVAMDTAATIRFSATYIV